MIWIQSFPSSRPVAIPRLKSPVCPTILPIPAWRIVGFMTFPMVLASRIWTRVVLSISPDHNHNHNTTGAAYDDIFFFSLNNIDMLCLHIRMKQPKLNRINFESNTNVLKCLLLLIETNKTLQQHTSRNNKHLQNSNVHAKVTLLLQYTHPLMMAQAQSESTRVPISYGSFIKHFPPDTIKSIRLLERT